MYEVSSDEIRAVVVETLAEQQKIHHGDIEAVVVRVRPSSPRSELKKKIGVNCARISSTSGVGVKASSRPRAIRSRR
jgi:hypothetical protein